MQEPSTFEQERLALLRAVNAVLAARRRILGAALVLTVLFVVWRLLPPRVYTSSITLQPQSRRAPGSLSSLATQLGVNVGTADGAQALAFYADLARSETILTPVVEQPLLTSTGRPITLLEYYEVVGDSRQLRSYRAVLHLRDDLHATVNARTGVLQLGVTSRDAQLALSTVQRVVAALDTFNLQTRQSQARLERRFTENRVGEARQELRTAEDKMRQFISANRGPRTAPDLKFEEDGLVREIGVRQQVYTTLMQMYEQARLEEVRDTPVLNVVEPALRAAVPDSRHIALNAIVMFAIVTTVSLMFYLVKAGFAIEVDPDPVGTFRRLVTEMRVDWSRLRLRRL